MQLPVYIRTLGSQVALITILVATVLFRFQLGKIENQQAVDIQLESLPMQIGEWQGRDTAGLDLRSQEILQLDRFVKRVYTNKKDQSVILYIGYWGKQSGEHQAAKHSPALCLPSNGWLVSDRNRGEIALENADSQAIDTKSLIGEFRGRKQLFYYWFFTGQTSYADEWYALLNISLQTVFAGRSDGGIVEVSTPLTLGNGITRDKDEAGTLIESFLDQLQPELQKIIDNPSEKLPENS